MIEFIITKAAVIITFILGFVMVLTALLTWVERKQSAVMQDRIGANRARLFGQKLLGLPHIICDATKMFLKEDFVPKGADRFLHTLAPFLSFTFVLAAFAAIPFGPDLQIAGRTIHLQIANINVGMVYLFAMLSIGVYGIILAGLSSNSNYGFLGGVRASSQMIAYEISLGAALVSMVMVYQTLDLNGMVISQGKLLWGWLPAWGILLQPVAFIIFTTAIIAESKRIPFDLPEGESEIVGYFVECSAMKFGLFFLADLLEVVLGACLVTTLFFGGWQVPYLEAGGFIFPWGASWALPNWGVVLFGVAAFIIKTLFFCFFFMVIRWTLPRFRYDQLMHLGWKIMFPIALVNIVITAFLILLKGTLS